MASSALLDLTRHSDPLAARATLDVARCPRLWDELRRRGRPESLWSELARFSRARWLCGHRGSGIRPVGAPQTHGGRDDEDQHWAAAFMPAEKFRTVLTTAEDVRLSRWDAARLHEALDLLPRTRPEHETIHICSGPSRPARWPAKRGGPTAPALCGRRLIPSLVPPVRRPLLTITRPTRGGTSPGTRLLEPPSQRLTLSCPTSVGHNSQTHSWGPRARGGATPAHALRRRPPAGQQVNPGAACPP